MKKGEILRSGSTVLPAPIAITVSDEIIWTSDTGRTLAGTMVGDIVAEKKNLKLKWGLLTEEDVLLIKKHLIAGFFPLTFHDDGVDLTITAYRGSMTKEQLGYIGDGYFWYRNVTVDVVQR